MPIRSIDLKEVRFAARFIIVLLFFHAAELHGGSADNEIVVNQGRYGPYYHLRLDLRADVIDFLRSDQAPRSGGQFELKLRPEKFPVPAPKCRGPIILRMPWTSPQAINAKRKIAAKENLLKRILALQKQPKAVLPVVIELNPYIEIVKRQPLKVQLTQCNVFFRASDGEYIDYTGPLRAS
jgi:hypothetical protein